MRLSMLDLMAAGVYLAVLFGLNQFSPQTNAARDDFNNGRIRGTLPWWAVGTSLIAANISAEQIIGMSGSAYAMGLAVASYEWIGAATLLVVGKLVLPIFLTRQVATLPQFLKQRFGGKIALVIAIFWIATSIFVVLTSTLWLGATAVRAVTGLGATTSVILLALFAGNFALYFGLRSATISNVVQVAMLLLGGTVIVYVAMERISGAGGLTGVMAGVRLLAAQAPDHFHMILHTDNPNYRYLPGLAVVLGGMWVVNFAYWGFNQYIVQSAIMARDVHHAQAGVLFAASLKILMPVLVVLPGIAAVVLTPNLPRPDAAYPALMVLLPSGIFGLVFVALVGAIITSMRATLNSIATIITTDIFPAFRRSTDRQLLIVEHASAIISLLLSATAAIPILDHFDQAFQYIQEYAGFFTPGVLVVFLLGLVWDRATETGALVGAISSPLLSTAMALFWPEIAFLNRMSCVFVIASGLAISASMLENRPAYTPAKSPTKADSSTTIAFKMGSLVVIGVLAACYRAFW